MKIKDMDNRTKAILVIVAAAAYLLWPVDCVPDIVPLIGNLDDFIVLFLGGKKAWSLLKDDDKTPPPMAEDKLSQREPQHAQELSADDLRRSASPSHVDSPESSSGVRRRPGPRVRPEAPQPGANSNRLA